MPHEAGFPNAARWSGALALVLALHVAIAWTLLSHGIPPILRPAVPEAVLLDLTPDLPPIQPAATVSPAPAELLPPPVPPPPELPLPVAEQLPVDLPLTPALDAKVVLPIPPPPRQPRPRPVQRPVQRVLEPSVERPPVRRTADQALQPVALAPAQSAPAQASAQPSASAGAVTPSWRDDLLARLQRAKRYPDLARSHGDQGVATVTFTMDRSGRVLRVALVRSSNSTLLDDEAVTLVRRAEPLPRLPDEMPGNSITLTVPISFALR